MEGARRFVSLARHRAVAAFCRAILEDPRRDLRAECKFDDGRTAVTGDNSFFSFFFNDAWIMRVSATFDSCLVAYGTSNPLLFDSISSAAEAGRLPFDLFPVGKIGSKSVLPRSVPLRRFLLTRRSCGGASSRVVKTRESNAVSLRKTLCQFIYQQCKGRRNYAKIIQF